MKVCLAFMIPAVVLVSSILISGVLWSMTCYFRGRQESFGFHWGRADPPARPELVHIEVYVTNSPAEFNQTRRDHWKEMKYGSTDAVSVRFVSTQDVGLHDTFLVACKEQQQHRMHSCLINGSWANMASRYRQRWFVLTTDDNWVNVTNLVRYVNLLEKMYDPTIHFVVQCMSADDVVYPLVNPLGTIIMSQAYVKLITKEHLTHHELEAVLAMKIQGFGDTLAVTMIIGTVSLWTTPYIISGCSNCQTALEDCTTLDIHRMSDVITYVRWKNGEESKLPNDAWYSIQNGKVEACRDSRDLGGTYSLLKMERTKQIVTEADLNRKALAELRQGTCSSCKAAMY